MYYIWTLVASLVVFNTPHHTLKSIQQCKLKISNKLIRYINEPNNINPIIKEIFYAMFNFKGIVKHFQ